MQEQSQHEAMQSTDLLWDSRSVSCGSRSAGGVPCGFIWNPFTSCWLSCLLPFTSYRLASEGTLSRWSRLNKWSIGQVRSATVMSTRECWWRSGSHANRHRPHSHKWRGDPSIVLNLMTDTFSILYGCICSIWTNYIIIRNIPYTKYRIDGYSTIMFNFFIAVLLCSMVYEGKFACLIWNIFIIYLVTFFTYFNRWGIRAIEHFLPLNLVGYGPWGNIPAL